jgi:hypothetical protein
MWIIEKLAKKVIEWTCTLDLKIIIVFRDHVEYRFKLTIEVYTTAATATISIEYDIRNPVTETTNIHM